MLFATNNFSLHWPMVIPLRGLKPGTDLICLASALQKSSLTKVLCLPGTPYYLVANHHLKPNGWRGHSACGAAHRFLSPTRSGYATACAWPDRCNGAADRMCCSLRTERIYCCPSPCAKPMKRSCWQVYPIRKGNVGSSQAKHGCTWRILAQKAKACMPSGEVSVVHRKNCN